MIENVEAKTTSFYLNNNFCSKHEQMCISLICYQNQCKGNRYSCVYCVDQQHHKHQLSSFNRLKKTLQDKIYHNIRLPQRQKIMKFLDCQRQQLYGKIDEIKAQILKQIYTWQDKVEKLFREIQQTFTIQDIGNISDKLFNNFDENQLEYYLQKIKLSQRYIFETNQSAIKSIKVLNKNCQKSFQSAKNQITSVLSKLLADFEMIKTSTFPKNKFYPKFSKNFKHSSLILSDSQNIIERVPSYGNYPMALLQNPLDPINNKFKCCIKKQQNQSSKYAWMGVCIYNVAKNFSYQNCHYAGRGVYAIDQKNFQDVSNAFSINHHQNLYNSSNVGFNFEVGQIIEIEVDFVNSLIYFKKGQIEFNMPIKLTQGPIYGFAGSYGQGDQIQILS